MRQIDQNECGKRSEKLLFVRSSSGLEMATKKHDEDDIEHFGESMRSRKKNPEKGRKEVNSSKTWTAGLIGLSVMDELVREEEEEG